MDNGSNKAFFIIVGLVTLVFLVGGVLLLASGGEKVPAEDRNKILLENASHFKGNESAQVTIVEFSDFQCPACAAFNPLIKQMLETYGDKVRLVYRHYPLNNIHFNAQEAAEAAEAADAQGKFWEYHDILFEKQIDWEKLEGDDLAKKLVEFAKEAGVSDLEKFEKEMKDGTYKDKVENDIKAGNDLGVNSTPSIYVNGTKLTTNSESAFESLIESKLE